MWRSTPPYPKDNWNEAPHSRRKRENTKRVWIRTLKRGDKIKTFVTMWPWAIREAIVEYSGMDWGYAKLYTEDWTLLNAGGYVRKDWDYYVFTL